MENRYAEGRTQDVAEDQRTPPRRPWADSGRSLGCGRGRLEAAWEQNTALGQELFLLAQIAQLSCCGSPPSAVHTQQSDRLVGAAHSGNQQPEGLAGISWPKGML